MGRNIITDEDMKLHDTIIIQRPLGRLTLTADTVSKMYSDKLLIDSILLMLIDGKDTWENPFEVEFNRQDAKEFLSEYFKGSYTDECINRILKKLA